MTSHQKAVSYDSSVRLRMEALMAPFRYRELIWVLVYRDILGRTRASLLGLGWIILQPVLATGVLTFLVQSVLDFAPEGELPYPVFVFSGMAVWMLFSSSLTSAVSGLVSHADLLRQVRFPREVLTMYHFISKLADFLIHMVVLGLMMALFSVPITPSFLWGFPLLLPAIVFGYGLALMLAPLNIAVRDVERALPFLLNFALYATPVLYPVGSVPQRWQFLYMFNPVSLSIQGFRDAVFLGQLPAPTPVLGASLVAVVTWMVGQWIFDLFEQTLADLV